MAIFHFSAELVSRADGSRAVASAAYRSASWLQVDGLGRGHNVSNKAGVIPSEVMQANGASEHWPIARRNFSNHDTQLTRMTQAASLLRANLRGWLRRRPSCYFRSGHRSLK